MAGTSSFTIGKLDAGVAILLGENAHLIEFPSLLLPPNCQPGSIISVSCTRDTSSEKARLKSFNSLQSNILKTFGESIPTTPKLSLKNVTQTSVVLEWNKLDLATSKLIGLTICRNGQRLTSIPNPLTNTSTKLSGLDLDTEYDFHLVLTTSAGTFNSEHVKVRTHKITDTSGICVCFGTVEPSSLLSQLQSALNSMKCKYSEKIQIETTHFVCTSPGTGGANGPGVQYQRALQLSIPTVLPGWIFACEKEKRMVPISQHYLGSNQNVLKQNQSQTRELPSNPPNTVRQSLPSEPNLPSTSTPIARTQPQSPSTAQPLPSSPVQPETPTFSTVTPVPSAEPVLVVSAPSDSTPSIMPVTSEIRREDETNSLQKGKSRAVLTDMTVIDNEVLDDVELTSPRSHDQS